MNRVFYSIVTPRIFHFKFGLVIPGVRELKSWKLWYVYVKIVIYSTLNTVISIKYNYIKQIV